MHGVDSSTDLSTYEQDLTLQHPRCVYQIMKRHFARYTPEMVERLLRRRQGSVPECRETLLRRVRSGKNRRHLLRARLDATFQRRADHPLRRDSAVAPRQYGTPRRRHSRVARPRLHSRFHGYPHAFRFLARLFEHAEVRPSSKDLASFIKANKPRTGLWNNFDKYIVSLLKAFYGDEATKENDFGFNWLPRLTGDHSHQAYWLDMLDGKMDGLFVMGQNPAVAGPNSGMERRGLGKLKWLVVREMVETETASFWYDSPEVQSGELRTEDIETEVFLMPAAGHVEKEGTFTNTQRLLQWREKAIDPPGDARSENWFMYHLWRRIVEKAKLDPRPRNQGLLALTMDYTARRRPPRTSVAGNSAGN